MINCTLVQPLNIFNNMFYFKIGRLNITGGNPIKHKSIIRIGGASKCYLFHIKVFILTIFLFYGIGLDKEDYLNLQATIYYVPASFYVWFSTVNYISLQFDPVS